jgi:GNAT superfamily N-acetyltransferase
MIARVDPDRAPQVLDTINAANRAAYRGIIPEAEFRDPFLTLDELVSSFSEMRIYAYLEQDEALGVAALWAEDAVVGRICRVYVLPAHQRRGIGTALMGYVEQEAAALGLQRLRLHVVAQAGWAVSFYRQQGYRVVECLARPQGRVLVMEKGIAEGQ